MPCFRDGFPEVKDLLEKYGNVDAREVVVSDDELEHLDETMLLNCVFGDLYGSGLCISISQRMLENTAFAMSRFFHPRSVRFRSVLTSCIAGKRSTMLPDLALKIAREVPRTERHRSE